MRKKIGQISEGKFDIRKPEVEISVEAIELCVQKDEISEGSFEILSKNGEPIKGFLLSTHPRMKLLCASQFIEEEYTVHYRFEAFHYEEGQKEKGQFIFITDGGEFHIPYEVTIQDTYRITSLGEMNQLKEFGELAKESKEEALRLFSSNDFPKIFLKQNKKLQLLYQGLKESRSIAQAMEEFLVCAHKKSKIHVTVKQRELQIDQEQEEYILEIERNCKGYVGALLQTDSTYFTLEKEILHEEDFHDNIAVVKIFIAEKSRSIHSWETALTIYCGEQIIQVPICYQAGKEARMECEKLHQKLQWKRDMVALYESWFLYGTNHITEEEYKKRERTYALQIQESEEGRKTILPEDYSIRLLNKIPEEVVKNKKERKKLFLSFYESGFHSPFLYYEMVKDMNEEVELLSEITNAQLAALQWGNRYDFVSPRLIDRFMQLVFQQKQFSKKVFRVAEQFYKKNPLKEYLTILCGNLIKGDRVEHKYHRYYKKGIESSLKLIGLCEAFIRSMDTTCYELIPRSVLLYFIDADPLPDNEREYLFANILHNEKHYDGILYQYGEKIQTFLKEQMKKGKINDHLFYLYKQNFEQILLSEEMIHTLPGILFKKKLVCHHPLITGAILYHEETKKVEYVPFTNHIAYVDLYTENYQILLLDKLGRRYANTISYELQTLFEDSRYIRLCYEHSQEHPMLLYRLGRHTLNHGKSDAKSIQVAKQVLQLPDIDEDFYWQILKTIIDYYYENYEGDLLEEYLKKVKLDVYNRKERNQFIEYMIVRRMYGTVLQAVELYGYDGVSPKKIVHLTSYLLKSKDVQEDTLLLEMCLYAFRNHQYDMELLEYIGKYTISSLHEMITIWKTAFKHTLRIPELEENLLAQSLFEERIEDDLFPIFSSFYERNTNHMLSKAFLRYVSYDRFMKEKMFPEEFYQTLKAAILDEQLTDNFSKMALLYYLSEQEAIEEDMIDWVKQNIQKFLIAGLVMPFFKKFHQIVLPTDISIQTMVCWKGQRESHYYIRYSLKVIGEWKKEKVREMKMKEIMPGIYVTELVIFQEEEISYSIWQREEHLDRMVKMGTFYPERMPHMTPENRFDTLNSLVSMQETKDREFGELAKDYLQKSQIMNCEWTLL